MNIGVFKKQLFVALLSLVILLLFASCQEEEQATTQNSSVKINIPTLNINFGSIVWGQNSDQTYIFTNDPSSGDKLKGVIRISGNGFYIVSGGGGYSVLTGQSRSVKVRFFPDRRGNFTGTLSIEHNAGNKASPINVALAGTAQ
ncbi:MAG: hypothetical protein HY960_09685 [Ignavibacteriae bacterium]|nr:hypothetical protein [Ignavibacteriota bacterium]